MALNYTGSKSLLISGQHYLHATQHNDEENDSKALKLGRAIHSLVLEPDTFLAKYAVAKDFDRRTTEGKKLYAEFVALHEGKEIIDRKSTRLNSSH